MIALSIPSPANGVWHLGPLPLRGYALCIILGIVAAIWLSERRWVARGGRAGDIQDIAIWAVPFGLVGGRLYHVATDHALYFGAQAREIGNSPWDALAIWRGGLGVWGSVALGALGAVIAARRKGIRLLPVLDVMAPTVLVAQAIGRWGNWFNQELYGRPTDLPWGLEIDPSHYPAGLTFPAGTTFHPTYLYEFVWNLLGFAFLLWLERRHRIGHGRMVALFVMVYCVGRAFTESLRIDTVELNDVLGLRFNVWTSIVLFVAAAIYLVVSLRRSPGREDSIYVPGREPVADDGVPDDGVPDDGVPDDGVPDDGVSDELPQR